MKKDRSKELAYILRHDPSKVEGTLDKHGWMDVSYLKKAGWAINELEDIVNSDEKGRYELSQDFRKIRALQGHSVKGIEPDYEPWTGKDILYHGTQSRFIESIYKNGLQSKSREYVHLSQDIETAKIVASRRGDDIAILEVNVENLGAVVSKNGVVLVKNSIPSDRIVNIIYPNKHE